MLLIGYKEKLESLATYYSLIIENFSIEKLHQLLYLTDMTHYLEIGRSVTGLDYYASDNGPKPTTNVDISGRFDLIYFTKRELRIIGQIARAHRQATSVHLLSLTAGENSVYERAYKSDDKSIDFKLFLEDLPEEKRAILLDMSQNHEEMITNYKSKESIWIKKLEG